jgi:hypothetical protein
MSLSTDDLRSALDEQARAPYDAASTARLSGVRARAQRRQRTRAAALGVAGVVALVAAVGGAALVRDGRPEQPAKPAPSPAPSEASLPTLGALYDGQDVVAQLSGRGDQTPAKMVTWPTKATALAVWCSTGQGRNVQIVLRTFGGEDLRTSAACLSPAPQWLTVALPDDAARIAAGSQVELQARPGYSADQPLDPPTGPLTETGFVVAVLSGDYTVVMQTPADAPKGYEWIGSQSFHDGRVGGTGTPESATTRQVGPTEDGDVVLPPTTAARVSIDCRGPQDVTVRLDGEQVGGTISCPDSRVSQHVDVAVPAGAGQQHRLRLDVVPQAPGALAIIAVSTR